MKSQGGSNSCPSGLEDLNKMDHILVYQKVDLVQVLMSCEVVKNKYFIMNNRGQQIYYAAEESNCLGRNCYGIARPFEMSIVDNFGKEVIHLKRPSHHCCCVEPMEVTSPPGTLVGTVVEQCNLLYPKFLIKNASGDAVFRIEGPFCACAWCHEDVNFGVYSVNGDTQVGMISKKWSGFVKEFFTDADSNFGISFPMNLDITMKAIMLGACFLIDMMHFENTF